MRYTGVMPTLLSCRKRALLGAAGAALLLGACRAPLPPPALPPVAAAPATAVPTPPGAGTLAIDAAASLIAITVRRGGPLARLGHDLDELTVDEPGLRAAAGLDTRPSAEAIAGTRHNMLTRVLDAERFPWVDVAIARSAADTVDAAITLHGVTRRYTVPVALEQGPAGVRVRGTLALRQTDFGLVPFAVLGGAMAVQDELALRFDIVARTP
jgi:hypothetical protein